MNPLDLYPNLRRVLYIAQWVVNLILGVIAVVLTALGESPTWFIIVGAVFNFVWSYTGITAQTNTAADVETYEADDLLLSVEPTEQPDEG